MVIKALLSLPPIKSNEKSIKERENNSTKFKRENYLLFEEY